jgi:hypothetical protein
MPVVERRLDALIYAGWNALQSDSEPEDLDRWREQAYQCLTTSVGEDHPYAAHFKCGTHRGESSNLLIDVGVLTAAKLWLFQGARYYDADAVRDPARPESKGSIVRSAAPFCCLKLTTFSGGQAGHGNNTITNHIRGSRPQDERYMTVHKSPGVRGCQQEEIVVPAC